jgi:uncharacterized protein YegP (UPF0339 family)
VLLRGSPSAVQLEPDAPPNTSHPCEPGRLRRGSVAASTLSVRGEPIARVQVQPSVDEDAGDEYRWHLESANGRLMADSGEGYADRGGAEDAVERFETYASEASVLDVGRAAFELFEDSAGDARWRLRHRNGNILADSGQGYADRTRAREGIESVKRHAPNADTEE